MLLLNSRFSHFRSLKRITLAVVILIILALLSSCENNHVEEAKPAGTINPCDTIVVKFNSDLVSIFTAKCATSGCHDGSNDPDLTSNLYSNLQSSIGDGKFKTKVLDERSMPQAGSPPLSTAEYLKIKCWFENGHLNN